MTLILGSKKSFAFDSRTIAFGAICIASCIACNTPYIAPISTPFFMPKIYENIKRGSSDTSVTLPPCGSLNNLIAFGAICIAMSFALSYVRLFKLPQGGSVTLVSLR